MIEAREAIRAARALLGTPYGELDCIGLVARVIRTAPGGVPGYRTAGTNTLWRSAGSAEKYRDLVWRQEGLAGAKAGMLAFKRSGSDVHHVGLVTGEGTVIHSSSAKGCVVETELSGTWRLLAVHRYIGTSPGPSGHPPQGGGLLVDEEKEDGSMEALYRATVTTQSDPLRVREAPKTGRIIGHVPKGRTVDVLGEGEWLRIRYGETVGYASAAYLRRVEGEPETSSASLRSAPSPKGKAFGDEGAHSPPLWGGWPEGPGEVFGEAATSLVREDGVGIVLGGKWRVAED